MPATAEMFAIDAKLHEETRVALAVRIAGVATAYVFAARLGLTIDAVGGFATLVWPASGIGLAAVLLGGYKLWPAIAIGAFAANVLTGAPPLAAVGIAIGNSAEALLGAYLLRRIPSFRTNLERERDVLALMVFAACISTTVSATVGVASLLGSQVLSYAKVAETWRAWWVGDLIGDLLMAPLILVWAKWNRADLKRAQLIEPVILAITIVVVSLVVFGPPGSVADSTRGREYLLFPPIIWAALRFAIRGSVTSTFAVTVIAITQTAILRGPFVRPDFHQSLLALQIFMGVTGGTFLLLGASISRRRRTQAALREAREVAESANNAKAGFLAMVSHELRTPLNAMTGYLDLLSMEVDGPLNDKQRARIDRISQSQHHLLSLIEDVLGFAQVEAGRLSFDIEPVQLKATFESIEPIVGAELARKGLTLVPADIGDSLFVDADVDRLRQIILNLVTNAIKFTPPGGRISLGAHVHDNKVQIAVTDTGIGIPEASVDRVFELFFQVDQGDTRRYPGLGIGLSIVRDAVLAMQGGVRIESVEGEGTTVFITLPLSRMAPGETPTQPEIGGLRSFQGRAVSS